MVLPAPGLLSTMIGWPSSACSGAAISRATMSDEPPGEKVTTMRMGLVGQACAHALAEANKAMTRNSFMSASSISGVAPGRAEQRHVVVLRRVRDLEAKRDQIEKPRRLEIFPDVEHQLIGASAEALAFEQRRLGAPVGVGLYRLERLPRATF